MRPCSDCPFMKSSPLDGSPDWLRDVLEHHTQNKFFRHTCHKTDPKADGYVNGEAKECRGHIQMQLNEWEHRPGRGGAYGSITEMAKAYLNKWGIKLPPGARLIHVNRQPVKEENNGRFSSGVSIHTR